MGHILKVFGNASGREIREFSISESDLKENLMSFLIKNNISIASSCSGVGSCQKCRVFLNEIEVLSCQKSLRCLFSNDKIITIVINYL